MDKSKSGKAYAKVRVETSKPGTDRDGNARNFTTRFDVAVYGQDAQNVAALQPGTLVWATGEVSAKVDEYNGKTYAKLQIIGRVGVITADFESAKKEAGWDDTPRQQTPPPAPKPRVADPTPTGEPPEEDDVPF